MALNDVSKQFVGGSVKITGLSKLNRALTAAGNDSSDMKVLMHEIGTMVIRAANPPVLTGRLSQSLKAGKGKTKAVVRAGGARIPYGPVIHYGNSARNIEPNPFLLNAMQQQRQSIIHMIDNGIKDIMRRNNLT